MSNVITFPSNPELVANQLAGLKTLTTLAAIAQTYSATLDTTLKEIPWMYLTTVDEALMQDIKAELEFAIDAIDARQEAEDVYLL